MMLKMNLGVVARAWERCLYLGLMGLTLSACQEPAPKALMSAGDLAGSQTSGENAGEVSAGVLAGEEGGETGGEAGGEAGGEVYSGDTAGMSIIAGEVIGGETAGEVIAGEVTGGEVTGGEVTGGEVTGGEVTGGEVTGGEVTGGEVTGGEVTGGEVTGGEVTGGEVTGGEVTGGESMAGESVAGESMAGESVAGESVAGESMAGESMAGESMAGMLPEEPVEGCVGPAVQSEHLQPLSATEVPECVTCVGSLPPNFIMRDLNPLSCGVGQYYGLDQFQSEVTLVVLLRSTCGYCQAQLLKLAQLRFELLVSGHVFWLVVINESGTGDYVSYLTDRSSSAILQDTPEVGAWYAMGDTISEVDDLGNMVMRRVGGDKDDMYIYGTDGTLARFLDDDDRSFSLNLNTEEGYENLRSALLGVITGEQ